MPEDEPPSVGDNRADDAKAKQVFGFLMDDGPGYPTTRALPGRADLPTIYKRVNPPKGMVDNIIIPPRSHGVLADFRKYGSAKPAPTHSIKIFAGEGRTDTRNVHTRKRLIGTEDRYQVTYDVWNYRDIPIVAQLARTLLQKPEASGR
jgi:hypothetical protein